MAFDVDLDLEFQSRDSGFEGGTVSGTARFERCPVERTIEDPGPPS